MRPIIQLTGLGNGSVDAPAVISKSTSAAVQAGRRLIVANAERPIAAGRRPLDGLCGLRRQHNDLLRSRVDRANLRPMFRKRPQFNLWLPVRRKTRSVNPVRRLLEEIGRLIDWNCFKTLMRSIALASSRVVHEPSGCNHDEFHFW